MPPAEVDGVWVFSTAAAEGREWGTAVLSRSDGERRRIYTARYALDIKGKERGKFEASVEEVGSGPVEALDRLLHEAHRRIDDEQPPLSGAARTPGSRRPPRPPMAHLARGEGAALLERFRRLPPRPSPAGHPPARSRRRRSCCSPRTIRRSRASASSCKARGENVGVATVYRTLDVLVESGLVRAHDFGEGFKRYEPMPAQAYHEHLICERCGRVVEFQNERLERMLPVIADEHAFQHQRHRVEIYGVCRECRQRELAHCE